MIRNQDIYITTKEVAKKLHISEEHVRNLARRGEIPAYRYGKLWRFNMAEILALNANDRVQHHNKNKAG